MDEKIGQYKGKDIKRGTDAQVAEQMKAIDAIPAQDIKSETPVTVPTPTNTSSTQAIDQISQEVQTNKLRAEKELDTSKKNFEQRIQDVVGVMGSRDRLEDEQGLGQARLDTADIRNQIEAREMSLRRAIETTQKTAGLSGGQIARQVQALNRDASRELADLSIIESARLRRMDAIETNIDRKISSQLEPLQFQLQFDQMFYQENKQALTKAQDQEFQLKIASEERNYQEKLAEKESIKGIALSAAQYGATGEQVKAITDAGTFEEAMSQGASFLGEPFRIQVEAHKSQMATQSMQRSQMLEQMAALKVQAQQVANEEMIQKIENAEVKTAVVDNSLSVVDRLLKNDFGLKASTGSLPFGLDRLPVGIKFNPLNPAGAISPEISFAKKQNFLSDADFIINNLTFDKLKELKAGGATFGALSEGELRTIGSASDVLSSKAIRNKQGQITGFTGSESDVRRQITIIQEKMQKEKASIGSELLSPEERLQIINN